MLSMKRIGKYVDDDVREFDDGGLGKIEGCLKKKTRKLKKEGMLGAFRQVGTMVQPYSRALTRRERVWRGNAVQASRVSEIGRDRSKGSRRRMLKLL